MQTVAEQVSMDALQMVWDGVIASRYEILMLLVGLFSYMALSSARTRWELKTRKKDVISSADPVMQHSQQYDEGLLTMHIAKCEREQARRLVKELLDRPNLACSFDLAMAILGFCRMSLADRHLADGFLVRMGNGDIDLLSEFIHFYLDSYQFDKACDVFEQNSSTFFDGDLGQDTEWSLMNAALKCGRVSVAKHLFETSQLNAAAHVQKIQRWWKRTACRPGRRSREQLNGQAFERLANVFNARFNFEVDSNPDSYEASTMILGSDSDRDMDLESDSCESDENDWSSTYQRD
jgi:hypothetical protein